MYDFNTEQVKWKNECDEAAIYGLDGVGWYWSAGFPDLNQQSTVEITGLTDADKQTHTINEWNCVLGAAEGKKKPSLATDPRGWLFGVVAGSIELDLPEEMLFFLSRATAQYLDPFIDGDVPPAEYQVPQK